MARSTTRETLRQPLPAAIHTSAWPNTESSISHLVLKEVSDELLALGLAHQQPAEQDQIRGERHDEERQRRVEC